MSEESNDEKVERMLRQHEQDIKSFMNQIWKLHIRLQKIDNLSDDEFYDRKGGKK